jgi:hypothetical protein
MFPLLFVVVGWSEVEVVATGSRVDMLSTPSTLVEINKEKKETLSLSLTLHL